VPLVNRAEGDSVPKEPKTTKGTRKPGLRKRKEAAPVPAVTHDDIAERAYAHYVAGVEGGPFEHWVRAERELTAA
jgi:hypothetical protein